MRSNEELAQLIRDGNGERQLELWEQIKRYAMKTANRWLAALPLRCDIEFDDLMSTAYIAMSEAVTSYKADSGAFTTWYSYHLKKAYTELYGLRTVRAANDPLNNAVSLSTPIDESGETTLGDTVPDSAGAVGFERAENEIYRQQLRSALSEALQAIPAKYRDVIERRFFHGQTVKSIAAEQLTTPAEINWCERSGLQNIRRGPSIHKLREFSDFNCYKGTGLRAYRISGSSIQENYLLFAENGQKCARKKETDL